MNWFAMVYLILVCLTVDSRYRSFGYTIFFSLFGLFIISSWQIYDHCGYVNKLYCFWAKHCSFLNCSDQETFSLMFLIQIISLTSCVHLLTSVWSGLFNKSAMWTAESLRVFKGENATLTELKQNLCCYFHFFWLRLSSVAVLLLSASVGLIWLDCTVICGSWLPSVGLI